MKNSNWIIAWALLCFIGTSCATSRAKTERNARQRDRVKELIESRNFTIEIDRAVPQRGRTVHLTSPYKLRLAGDSVESYLPYFGRAYHIPYDGGKGLIFEAPASDYKLSFDKKGKATLVFKTQTDEDRFTYTLYIFDNGASSVNVVPLNRQSITYYGRVAGTEN